MRLQIMLFILLYLTFVNGISQEYLQKYILANEKIEGFNETAYIYENYQISCEKKYEVVEVLSKGKELYVVFEEGKNGKEKLLTDRKTYCKILNEYLFSKEVFKRKEINKYWFVSNNMFSFVLNAINDLNDVDTKKKLEKIKESIEKLLEYERKLEKDIYCGLEEDYKREVKNLGNYLEELEDFNNLKKQYELTFSDLFVERNCDSYYSFQIEKFYRAKLVENNKLFEMKDVIKKEGYEKAYKKASVKSKEEKLPEKTDEKREEKNNFLLIFLGVLIIGIVVYFIKKGKKDGTDKEVDEDSYSYDIFE